VFILNDLEIYELAQKILYGINDDFKNGIYSELGGDISLSWIDKPAKFNAWAESCADINNPPDHKVVLFYELARLIYRDIESFYDFCTRELVQKKYQLLFQHLSPAPFMPADFTKEASINNMFAAALTWVYFHEVGHAAQEHGYVGDVLGFGRGIKGVIHESESYSTENPDSTLPPLTGKAAVLSHTMEFAADFEGTHWCLHELVRHFAKPDPGKENFFDESENEDFRDAVYLFVCGLACVFYRFHGFRSLELSPLPEGTHPNPIVRLEVSLPHIIEYVDLLRAVANHGLTRAGLVHFLGRAAESVALFWIWRESDNKKIPDNYILQGLLNRPDLKEYFSAIVKMWDEIFPIIQPIRRFGPELGILNFTEDFRKHIL
jgi:hypothetical protein